jgi:hypothetical protein
VAEYLDPVVAEFTGDNSGLLSSIAESQAAMEAFAASAPTLGQSASPSGGAAEEAAAGLQAGAAAALAANAPEPEDFAPLIDAARAAGEKSGKELGRNLTEAEVAALSDQDFERLYGNLQASAGEAGRAAGTNLGRNLTEAEVAALGDDEFDTYLTHLRDTAQEASQAMEASAAGGGEAMAERWAGWAAEAEQAGAEAEIAGQEVEDLGNKTEDAGRKAAASRTNWLALGAGFLAVTAGPLLLSSAIVGVGYEIANLGGEARGQLQIVEENFRSAAAQASQAFEPAIQNITAGLDTMVHRIEPQMAEMFVQLRGPAQAFASGLEGSIEQGMQAAIPAVQAMGPVIAQVAGDLGPLFQGVAGFVTEMAGAFTGNGGNQWLGELADDMGRLLPVAGELVGEIGSGLLPILDAAANVARILGDVLNGLGSPIDTMIVGGIAVGRAWSMLTSGVDTAVTAWNKSVDVLEAVSGWISTHLGLTQADTVATAEAAVAQEAKATFTGEAAVADQAAAVAAGEAAVAIEAEGVAAAGAAVEMGAFLAALGPLVAIAGGAIIGWTVGVNIGDGLKSGLSSAWGDISGAMSDMAHGIENAFNDPLGIASPSTVMAARGQDVAAGVAQGIGAGAPMANAAAAAMANGMTTAFATGVSGGGGGYGPPSSSFGGGGGGGTSVYLTVQVTSPLGTPQEVADALLPIVQQINIDNGQSMFSHTGLKGGRF